MSSYGVYTQRYFADSGQIQYEQRRLNCHRKSLLEYSPAFFNQLTTALKAKFRVHSGLFVKKYWWENKIILLSSLCLDFGMSCLGFTILSTDGFNISALFV